MQLISFRLGEQRFAVHLTRVREVLRLAGLRRLPGVERPMAGVMDLRGTPLPVYDPRPDEAGGGDVLVVDDRDGGLAGVAVDEVLGVSELEPGGRARPPAGLPGYVTEVMAGPDGPVLVVDLLEMVGQVPAGG